MLPNSFGLLSPHTTASHSGKPRRALGCFSCTFSRNPGGAGFARLRSTSFVRDMGLCGLGVREEVGVSGVRGVRERDMGVRGVCERDMGVRESVRGCEGEKEGEWECGRVSG